MNAAHGRLPYFHRDRTSKSVILPLYICAKHLQFCLDVDPEPVQSFHHLAFPPYPCDMIYGKCIRLKIIQIKVKTPELENNIFTGTKTSETVS